MKNSVGNALYLDSGYLNIPAIFNDKSVFNFIIGARGIGKTFGVLEYCIKNKKKFMYMRRTQKHTDIINKEKYSPLKSVCDYMGKEFSHVTAAKGSVEMFVDGESVGFTGALSTFASLRSFDMSDIEVIIYDEFIPELSERVTISHEFEAFLNMYETVNRNRELKGKAPVKLFALANSNRIDNKIFLGLRIVNVIDSMYSRGAEIWKDGNRSIAVYCLMRSPISQKKAETALYKFAKGTDFDEMALNNSFRVDTGDVIKYSLKEFKPIVNIGELCVYMHKSKRFVYISNRTASGSAPVYGVTENELNRFKRDFSGIVLKSTLGIVTYENITSKMLFKSYLSNS